MPNHIHHQQGLARAGQPLHEATCAMILIHGRGATAPSILDLAPVLPHPEMAYLAPQAAMNTWYNFSFLAPLAQNQPGLDSALRLLAELVEEIEEAGIPAGRIILAGFSQGACLTAEFVARNARRYGGLLVFSGGLIGPPGTPRHYSGSLDNTPIFIGCSDVDFHIPVERVHETATILTQLSGHVTKTIYPNMGHTIIQDEIAQAQHIIEQL